MRPMICRTALGVVCLGLVWAARPVHGATGGVVYHLGFEHDVPRGLFALGRTPEGLNDLSNCGAVLVEQGVCDDDRAHGKRSYRIHMAFRGDGSANPTFYFAKPIPVVGPLYVSCYFKVVEQDPESSHRIRLLAWGEFPNDPQPTLGKLSTVPTRAPAPAYVGHKPVWKGANLLTNVSQPAPGGWVFRRSDDVHQRMLNTERIRVKDGMCLFGLSVSVWGCRAGRRLTLLVDEIRLTRDCPLLPPSARELAEAVAVFRRLGADYGRLSRRYGDAAAKAQHTRLHTRLENLARQVRHDGDTAARTRFVDLIGRMRRSYYTLKITEMSEAP